MKARYIGGESEPGSQETIVFGNIKVRCGQVFEVPPQFEQKVRINPWFEVIEDAAPPVATEELQAEAPAPKTRKRKEKDNGEPVA